MGLLLQGYWWCDALPLLKPTSRNYCVHMRAIQEQPNLWGVSLQQVVLRHRCFVFPEGREPGGKCSTDWH